MVSVIGRSTIQHWLKILFASEKIFNIFNKKIKTPANITMAAKKKGKKKKK
ncbi:hypothetical protein GW888_01095 [Candidatus Wolfebacteria bacterium]|nr:hypothetical protein [Candidatus Wolfebacteria bacterium]NCO44653.1 hypothetical protein [Candidatus Wolfebacteria bacterium]